MCLGFFLLSSSLLFQQHDSKHPRRILRSLKKFSAEAWLDQLDSGDDPDHCLDSGLRQYLFFLCQTGNDLRPNAKRGGFYARGGILKLSLTFSVDVMNMEEVCSQSAPSWIIFPHLPSSKTSHPSRNFHSGALNPVPKRCVVLLVGSSQVRRRPNVPSHSYAWPVACFWTAVGKGRKSLHLFSRRRSVSAPFTGDLRKSRFPHAFVCTNHALRKAI